MKKSAHYNDSEELCDTKTGVILNCNNIYHFTVIRNTVFLRMREFFYRSYSNFWTIMYNGVEFGEWVTEIIIIIIIISSIIIIIIMLLLYYLYFIFDILYIYLYI